MRRSVNMQVFKRVGEEKLATNIQAAGDILARVVERIMLLQKASDEEVNTTAIGMQDWLSKHVLSGIFKAICRSDDILLNIVIADFLHNMQM